MGVRVMFEFLIPGVGRVSHRRTALVLRLRTCIDRLKECSE
jgi:hypothetical protein